MLYHYFLRAITMHWAQDEGQFSDLVLLLFNYPLPVGRRCKMIKGGLLFTEISATWPGDALTTHLPRYFNTYLPY